MQLLQSQFPNGGGFNAKTYGAKGDGSANESPAIQATIDAASTHAATYGRATVIIPPGKYKVIDEIVVKSNITYLLYGAYIFAGDFTGNEMFRMPSTAAIDYTVGASNVIWRGGILDAKGQTATIDQNKNIFTLANCSDWRFEDTTFRNVPNWHAIDMNCVQNVFINNCRFEGFVENSSTERGFSEAIQLDVGNPKAGPTKNVTVMGCYMGPAVDGSGLGGFGKLVGSHTSLAGSKHTNIRIIGNVAEDANDVAIQGFTWEDALIAGNIISNPASHAIMVTQDIDNVTERITVRDNIIRDFPGGGAYFKYDWGASDVNANPNSEARSFENCEVSGNIFDSTENSTTSAIHLIVFNESTVEGNIILNTGAHGIFADELRELTINGNFIKNATATGIQFDTGQRCDFSCNQIYAVGDMGVWLANSSQKNHLWANYIVGANRNGGTNQGGIEFSGWENSRNTILCNAIKKYGSGNEALAPIVFNGSSGAGSTYNTVAFNSFQGWSTVHGPAGTTPNIINVSGTMPSPTSFGADAVSAINSALG